MSPASSNCWRAGEQPRLDLIFSPQDPSGFSATRLGCYPRQGLWDYTAIALAELPLGFKPHQEYFAVGEVS